MAEHQDGQKPGEAPAAESRTELPPVEAPPLSPAGEEPVVDTPAAPSAPAAALIALPRWRLRPRHKRQALLAASVALAAGFGAVVGSLASTGSPTPPTRDVAAVQERKTMQQSIAHLSRQVALLKTDLEKANKAAHTQIAGLSQRLDAAMKTEITGSIPQAPAVAPVPMPRPAPRIAGTESRPVVVPDWSIRDARGGYVYVQSHGDIFQVVPGAILPGVGPVQSIKRLNGRWVVVTPRGIIVSLRDRRFFE
jgi:hypothetical protein